LEKIPRIAWNQSYSVNVEVLDDQHRKLFDIVNQVIDIYESGSGDLLAAINDLIHYLSVHFHQENMVMMNANYPGLLTHSKQHQQFTEKIEEFLKGYAKGDRDLGFKMVAYLKDWVRDHTTTADLQYGKYLIEHTRTLK
jgi:hemerythrin